MRQHERDLYRRHAEQHVYVIEFTSGVLKVGRTRNPDKRFADHAKSARLHGVDIARSWSSKPHVGYRQNEETLIEYCSARWLHASGNEYFKGADYEQVVRFAKRLPMPLLTEADIDAYAKRPVRRLFPWSAPDIIAEQQRLTIGTEANESFEGERIPLEDVAPGPESAASAEDITATSMAKHYAAKALLNHHLRYRLDPLVDGRAWKDALAESRHGYAVALLLRALQDHAAPEVAESAARALWAMSDGEYGEQLTHWVIDDDIDPAVLAEMARVSYHQVRKFKAGGAA